jgi:plastocyanin
MRRLLLLLLPAILLVAACGGDDETTTAASTEAIADTESAEGGGDDHGGHGGDSAVAEDARTIEVVGTSFAFDPLEIRAETGESLAIELTSEDVEHDFTIDELDAHVVADAGETSSGGFETGDRAGTYEYYCSVPGHREAGMEGQLVVEG